MMSPVLQSRVLQSPVLQSRVLQSPVLQSRVLQSRVLPSRALSLISEYSKPMTRPDWRKSKPIVETYSLFISVINDYSPLGDYILSNICLTDWYLQNSTLY